MRVLTDLLGDSHDLSALDAHLLDGSHGDSRIEALPAFLALLRQRRSELDAQAVVLGRKLYHDKPGRWVDRVGGWWSAWSDGARLAEDRGWLIQAG
jgi:hypothetical protein